jgi:hypothetical protein
LRRARSALFCSSVLLPPYVRMFAVVRRPRCSGKMFTKELRETSRVRLCRVRQPKVPFVYHACQTEGDGRKQTTDESSRTRPVEWRRLVEYLTNRIDDDDGEKWATVSIYRISSFKFFCLFFVRVATEALFPFGFSYLGSSDLQEFKIVESPLWSTSLRILYGQRIKSL